MKHHRLERSSSACNISSCLSVNLYRVGYGRLDKWERRRFGVALVRDLIACVCLLVVQPEQMSTRVNIPVARGGNVVVWLALRNQSMRILDFQTSTLMSRMVPAFGRISHERNQPMVLSDQLVADLMTLLFSFLGTFVVDARASGNTALSSPCWDLLATMRRVVNYHSSWARQRQVELFVASGNPGFTAGRGFNPAGGAPGGDLHSITALVHGSALNHDPCALHLSNSVLHSLDLNSALRSALEQLLCFSKLVIQLEPSNSQQVSMACTVFRHTEPPPPNNMSRAICVGSIDVHPS
ncbi:hypothetical protein F511_15024 [Dorcoceras hygrometricum]|uniref:Uncharacterized protein n=1 Tax=Dorcoceras hygrometricum TaxID=472368 RepID=A0A2Z7D0X3_9LAMI|nr:hypothetical protein F511_15024 [Dorcoceras hygrometricum]